MDGFGDFFGNLIGGLSEAGGDAVVPWAGGGYDSSMPEAGQGGQVADESYERYLAGGPRDLNINDL